MHDIYLMHKSTVVYFSFLMIKTFKFCVWIKWKVRREYGIYAWEGGLLKLNLIFVVNFFFFFFVFFLWLTFCYTFFLKFYQVNGFLLKENKAQNVFFFFLKFFLSQYDFGT